MKLLVAVAVSPFFKPETTYTGVIAEPLYVVVEAVAVTVIVSAFDIEIVTICVVVAVTLSVTVIVS